MNIHTTRREPLQLDTVEDFRLLCLAEGFLTVDCGPVFAVMSVDTRNPHQGVVITIPYVATRGAYRRQGWFKRYLSLILDFAKRQPRLKITFLSVTDYHLANLLSLLGFTMDGGSNLTHTDYGSIVLPDDWRKNPEDPTCDYEQAEARIHRNNPVPLSVVRVDEQGNLK